MNIEPLVSPSQSVVIVGAGLAGLKVAESLRQAGFPGRIVLIGDEPHAPYDRPPLSKAVLVGGGKADDTALLTPDALASLNVELRLGCAATGIDRQGRTVSLTDGTSLSYDRLVLATGSSIRTLANLPPSRPGVHYLRNLDDALALRKSLTAGNRLAVIGAGVIGLEVAAAAVQLGLTVVVIEAADRVMGRAACQQVSQFIVQRHQQAGVSFRMGVSVSEVGEEAGAFLLKLSDGSHVQADAVLVGVGVSPNLSLAREAGLEVEPGGIVVDAFGATGDPAIYAAGEVALHYNDLHGRHDRQETWAHASAHGAHVGRSLVVAEAGYAEQGAYWSDQYDVTLNVVGAPIGDLDVVRGDPASGKFIVFHLIDGTVRGVSAVNDARGLRAAKGLIGVRAEVNVLGDPQSDLRALAAAP